MINNDITGKSIDSEKDLDSKQKAKDAEENLPHKTYSTKIIRLLGQRLFALKLIGSFIILYTFPEPIFFILQIVAEFLNVFFNIELLLNVNFYMLIFFIAIFSIMSSMLFINNSNLNPSIMLIFIMLMIYLEPDITTGIIKFTLMLFLFELPTFIKKYTFYYTNNVNSGVRKENLRELYYIKATFDTHLRYLTLVFSSLLIGSYTLITLFSLVEIQSGYNSIVLPFFLLTIAIISLFYSDEFLYTLKVRKKRNLTLETPRKA